MLTLKKPVTMKTGKDIRTVSEKLNKTIPENYSILNERIDAENLLFLMTNPPEDPYIDNSSQNTSIINIGGNTSKVNVEVINNFINRIAAYGSANFTYQDSIFVSNVLHKLGITNANEFMTEVKNIKENTESVKKLINIYENNLEKIKNTNKVVVEQREKIKNDQTPEIEEENAISERVLTNNIYNRLQTAELYEIVNNYSQPNQFSNTVMSNKEMIISEQTSVYERLKLQMLKQETGAWEHENLGENLTIYEKHENTNAFYDKKSVVASAVAAGLLSVARSVFVNREESEFSNNHLWTNISNAIYQSAENTINRFNNYSPAETTKNQTYNLSIEESNKLYKEELNLTQSIKSFEESEEINLYNQLQEINKKNTEIYNQKLAMQEADEKKRKKKKEKPTQSKEKLMQAALLAIDNPEKAINNFFEEVKGAEKHIDLVQLYPALERMDSETRALNEALIMATLDPKKAEERGLIQKVDREVLLADLERINNPQNFREEEFYKHEPIALDGVAKPIPVPEEISAGLTETLARVAAIANRNLEKDNNQNTQEAKTAEAIAMVETVTGKSVSKVHNEIATFEEVEKNIKEELVYKAESVINETVEKPISVEKRILEEVAQVMTPIEKRISTELPQIKEIHKKVPIIHKEINDVSTEMFEEINKKINKNEKKVVVETAEKTEVINKQEINNITQQITERTTEKLAATIDRTILNQIDTITEKVYSKLERKLGNERSRRGY